MSVILVVDDSKVVRKIIISMLSHCDYFCLEAEDGIDALEKLVVNKVDMIIADLNMPKMTGHELVKTIRQSNIYNNIPILMLTTEQNEESKKMCMDAGANVYLAKPIPSEEIISSVKSLLNPV